MGKMKCSKCKGTNIQVLGKGSNASGKSQTSLNLNPLKPFTLVNTKEVKKKSLGKTALSVATLGMSKPFTGGTAKTEKYDVFCTECGHRWKTT